MSEQKMTEKQWVRDLQDKTSVESIFLVKEKFSGVGKNGRLYMSLQLGDKTGAIDARVWDRVEEIIGSFEVGDLVWVKGLVQVFQGRRQLVVHKIDKPMDPQVEMSQYIPESHLNVQDLFIDLINVVKTVKNDQIRQLLLDTIEDAEIKPKLMQAPAAKTIHHAWKGGLLEHILSITHLMNFMASHYKFLNRDFLIFGAIYHDIGKIWELSWENGIGYTDRGRLIGHLHMGCELLDKKSSRIFGFSEELRDRLKHIILSHHGKLEFGSPKRPKFMEALVVAMIDELDSRISSLQSLLENERAGGDRWSRYSEMYDRYFLLEDMNEKY